MADVGMLIVDIVALSGRKLVGRTRMQKTVYLLDVLGMKSGAGYYYYNFGPFSDEVADGISDSKFRGDLTEETEYRMSDGSPFSIFKAERNPGDVQKLGSLPVDAAKRVIERLSESNSTVLELAATIHWLAEVEKVQDWKEELRRRKGPKTQHGRMEKAAQLLGDLGVRIR